MVIEWDRGLGAHRAKLVTTGLTVQRQQRGSLLVFCTLARPQGQTLFVYMIGCHCRFKFHISSPHLSRQSDRYHISEAGYVFVQVLWLEHPGIATVTHKPQSGEISTSDVWEITGRAQVVIQR